jgi:hypothetical protein
VLGPKREAADHAVINLPWMPPAYCPPKSQVIVDCTMIAQQNVVNQLGITGMMKVQREQRKRHVDIKEAFVHKKN